jgi:hypothetical protein
VLAVGVSSLAAWSSFYTIIGSSAGALTGLMFVVISLTASRPRQTSGDGIAAYGTPNVVHFCAALAIAAALSAPWPALWAASIVLGIAGLGGVAYVVVVMRRVRRGGYRPVLEDWLTHVLLPLIAYVAVAASSLLLPAQPEPVLFVVGAGLLLLLFIGIHNAWDTVTYMVATVAGDRQPSPKQPE